MWKKKSTRRQVAFDPSGNELNQQNRITLGKPSGRAFSGSSDSAVRKIGFHLDRSWLNLCAQ